MQKQKSFSFPIAIFAIATTIFICACATVPYTGRTQFIMTSQQEENDLGEQAWREIISSEKVSASPLYNKILKECGTYIARAAERSDFRWEFKVLENPQVNAFCLPGGKVAVYTGLFGACKNEGEFAAVVGHEVGHAIARHGGERMTQQLIQQLGAEALKAGLGSSSKSEVWLVAYAGISTIGFILPYSRVHEYEADKIGMILMAKAGYDPRAAISFWQRLSANESEIDKLAAYLSTHPVGSDRIEEMKKILPEAMQYYNNTPMKRAFGKNF